MWELCNFVFPFQTTNNQGGLKFNLKDKLTTEVDILSEQDALFRLSLFNLKQVYEGRHSNKQSGRKAGKKIQTKCDIMTKLYNVYVPNIPPPRRTHQHS